MANNPQTQIDRIRANVTDALAAIAEKGVTVGSDANSDNLKPLIESIAQGVFLPTLTNEGAAADLLSGKQLIDSDGKVVTGSMAEVTQATPSITVSTGGLITASATQSAGKVAAGTKSATQQMTTQAAQTITPGTTSKTIASGRYLTGTQTIAGDANLIAANIKQGVSIFGVAGSLESGGVPSPIKAGNTPVMVSTDSGTKGTSESGAKVHSITIPYSGTYRFVFGVSRVGTNSSKQGWSLKKNSTEVKSFKFSSGGSVYFNSGSVDVSCASGDAVDLYITGANATYYTLCGTMTACIEWDNGF